MARSNCLDALWANGRVASLLIAGLLDVLDYRPDRQEHPHYNISAQYCLPRVDLMTEFAIGTVLNGCYRVVEVLHGGMGLVYVVEEIGTPIRRVLKTYPGAYLRSSPLFQCFIDEARLWLDISNVKIEPAAEPFIVRAYGIRIINGRPFIEIEYVNNGHLGSLGQVPLAIKIDLAVQCCKGMAFLNKIKEHFIHGDLKPENLLCKRLNGGELILKISDFGLSRFKRELASTTRDQALLLADRVYSAPECLSSNTPTDIRSDIFSFGLVLYRMLLDGTSDRLGRLEMASIAEDFRVGRELPMNRPSAKALSKDLRDILQTCLRPDPSRRYANFTDLEADLELAVAARSWDTLHDNLAAAGNVMTLDFDYFYKPLRPKLDPAEAAVHYASVGDWERAFDLFDEALATNPNDPETLTDKAHCLVECNRASEAIPLLHRALELNAQNPITWTVKGMAHDMLREFDLALSSYESAIAVDSTFADAWMNKGNLLSNGGHFEDALVAFRHAVELGSSRSTLWHNIGITCEKLRDFRQAADAYGKAFVLDGNIKSAVAQANCFAKQGDFSSAETALRSLLDVDDQNVQGWAALAAAYYNQGKWAACIDACDRVMQLDQLQFHRHQLGPVRTEAISRLNFRRAP